MLRARIGEEPALRPVGLERRLEGANAGIDGVVLLRVQVDALGTHLYPTSGLATGATSIASQYLIGASGALTP